ncbi:hypothetical protein E3N88_42763 [Mikania micrantha]|uniref:Iron hydrogenase small subunit domain-containing protein n=1 Tax=Mikania micrantha TaxID=192012 RepID=A0A5N6LGY0_9ASTR|nr:hypothetical protein E3N88_42763 [Mikania micrantha]
MSEKFSATLRIGDLNDFIAPSQGCVVSMKSGSARLVENLSGCITSAETVMLEKQSLDEFLSNINNKKTVIVSLSAQSRASIAVHYGLSPIQVFRKLTTLFKSLGVKAVFDTSCSRDLSLIESCWICYAEKTLGSFVLPYISSVKSPQQSIGAIIKHHLCQKLGLRPSDIYHVTVMPCYDKKLEASRDDFVFQDQADQMTTEVDSVLTTGEVLDLIQLKVVDFCKLDELSNVSEEGNLFGVRGSSGGYADTIFRYAAKTLFGHDIEGPLDFKPIRNSDFQEVTLEVEGKTVLKFALCYGFRNLQNVVRKLKIGKCDYHYLEIMACPSGCLNGGGQLKPKPGQSGKNLIQALEATYMENVLVADPFENPIVKILYDEWLEHPGSENAKRHIHTEYHPIVKSITSQLSNW